MKLVSQNVTGNVELTSNQKRRTELLYSIVYLHVLTDSTQRRKPGWYRGQRLYITPH